MALLGKSTPSRTPRRLKHLGEAPHRLPTMTGNGGRTMAPKRLSAVSNRRATTWIPKLICWLDRLFLGRGPSLSANLIELSLQPVVGLLEIENCLDSRQVKTALQETADDSQTFHIVVAVEACTPDAPGRGQQPLSLVEPKILGGAPHETGGNGDAVHPPCGIKAILTNHGNLLQVCCCRSQPSQIKSMLRVVGNLPVCK
jgi:hypothetical protein